MRRCLFALAVLSVALGMLALPRLVHGQPLPTWRSLLTKRAPAPPVVWYPASDFQMGSTPEEVLLAMADCNAEPLAPRCPDFSNEQPLRTIRLSAFALDTLEVSVAAYERCVAARRCRPIPYHRGARRFHRQQLPAVLVTHEDAVAYCTFMGGRLPTEAQFERAMRGSSRRRFPWGNSYHRLVANHGRLAFNATSDADRYVELAQVNSFPAGASPEGVLNLAGNAAEWVNDGYSAYYDERQLEDPLGPPADAGITDRVVRGGGYLSPAVMLRGAARRAELPTLRSAEVGFRCAYARP